MLAIASLACQPQLQSDQNIADKFSSPRANGASASIHPDDRSPILSVSELLGEDDLLDDRVYFVLFLFNLADHLF